MPMFYFKLTLRVDISAIKMYLFDTGRNNTLLYKSIGCLLEKFTEDEIQFNHHLVRVYRKFAFNIVLIIP